MMKQLKFNLKPLLEEKQINRYQLAQTTGLTYPTINNLYNGKTKSISFDTIDKLCNALNCTPNDLFGY